jgi:glucuronate isomerase
MTNSTTLRARLFEELDAIVLIDPHTHINPHAPAAATLADVLGYHYYTELAHSAGMAKQRIEEPGLDPKEKVGRLVEGLGPIENTIQYSWLIEMAQTLFGFGDDRLTLDNWEGLYDAAAARMRQPDWPAQVLGRSKLQAVFLTNDFDDPLAGFDTRLYVPCLRTDDLVFHLARPAVRERLERATGTSLGGTAQLRAAIGELFEHFVSRGARACAISLPPDFAPQPVAGAAAQTALSTVLSAGTQADGERRRELSNFVFWTLAEYCAETRLPFDLMIGVNRSVYADGVFQGQDLYDSRVSLIQYHALFNAFPQVVFPISVLASVTNHELSSYSWIFPNVVTHGHWWYSNTPTFIEHDAAARLEAVPWTKQIGYYSDMYKLEFALPKFRMYKRILAKILAERFVVDRGWNEERAVELGWQVLRGNVERVFFPTKHDG